MTMRLHRSFHSQSSFLELHTVGGKTTSELSDLTVAQQAEIGFHGYLGSL